MTVSIIDCQITSNWPSFCVYNSYSTDDLKEYVVKVSLLYGSGEVSSVILGHRTWNLTTNSVPSFDQ